MKKLLSLVAILGVAFAFSTSVLAAGPTIYQGGNTCDDGKEAIDTGLVETISPTDPDGVTITLTGTGEYLFEASSSYIYSIYGNGQSADAGYANNGDWSNLRTDIGIDPTATYRGVTSLLSDMGTGDVGIVEWGTFNPDHVYTFNYDIAGGNTVKFVISDWWDGWYSSSYNNQNGMVDNSGSLTVKVYRCVTPFVRTAEITAPLEDAEVNGLVSFEANLIDEDGDDGIQWAVRKGTCQAGVGTVLGNVDGRHDEYTWDHYTFHASADTSSWEVGTYCFVFNPTESTGDTPIRETREFTVIEADTDNDGVLDNEDKCEGTIPDDPDGLGTNRWVWYEGVEFTFGPIPGKGNGPKDSYSIADTYGCSCDQILEELEEKTGEDFEGHHKFGCSKSILEDWIKGEYLIETVLVPSNTIDGIDSEKILLEETDYILKASGTYTYNSAGDWADTEYFLRDGSVVTEGSTPYVLDVGIDDYTINRFWGDYNTEHMYELTYPGTGNTGHFAIYDSYNGDNIGNITVEIYAKLW